MALSDHVALPGALRIAGAAEFDRRLLYWRGSQGRRTAMKKIEAVVKPFKLDEVREALPKSGLRG